MSPAGSIVALATLGVVNTGIAYWLFYVLIDAAGAATALVITYVVPVVALFLGVAPLRERLIIGAVAGLVLITVGVWLATSRKTSKRYSRGSSEPSGPRSRLRSSTARPKWSLSSAIRASRAIRVDPTSSI